MKLTKILVGILFIICTGLGGYGFYVNYTKSNEGQYTVDYVYYLDDAEVAAIPGNIGAYNFSNYYCTNGVQGSFNEVNWEFIPSLTDNTACSIYFETKTYEVKISVVHATTPETFQSIVEVKRENSVQFTVEPDEGYQFDTVTCTNGEAFTYDEETKTVAIGPFTNGASCTVNFKISEFEVKLEATNAAPGSASVGVEYKADAVIDLTPTTNYILDKITCTNSQVATWKDNKLTVDEVTNDTTCTVGFKLKSYLVTINVTGGSVDVTSKRIAYGKSDSFTITADETHTLTDGTVACGTSATGVLTNSVLQVTSVKGTTTCTVTLPEKEDLEG